jgi:GMP synthase-like glutamine amidotransferase
MKYLKRFNESEESYSVFDSQGWKKFLPKELSIVTQNGTWKLEIPQEEYGMSHATNVTNLMNCLQINYVQNTPSREDGDVTRDSEPDQLEFDITIVKDNDGSDANPDTLKLNVDVTYGDAMVSEFTIEKPNKVTVLHYTGFGSQYDPNSFFGFEDESLEELVKFFNSWGYELSKKDFTFIDKYPDSYIHQKTNEGIVLNPSFDDDCILIINNSKPQENRYLTNVIKYLDFRAISWKIASTPEEVEKMNEEFNIIGAISTGSDYRVRDTESEDKVDINERAFDILDCPIFSICYGMQLLAKHYGVPLEEGEHVHGAYAFTKYEDHPIFEGVDMENTEFSFSFHDYLAECPSGFEVIGELDGKIAAIANDKKKQYATLFHPEDTEYTYLVLDNFISMCDGGQTQEAEDLKGNMKITNVVESYGEFIKKRLK